jgi:signal peptidase I
VRGRGLAAGLAVAATGVALARRRVRRYEIVEDSMEPVLRRGDYVLAVRIDTVNRGDIVVVEHPHRTGFELVKRVVGVPGELVVIGNGQVHIDGAPLAEPWAEGPTWPDGEWHLSLGSMFLLGDQRSRSVADGRELGPLPVTSAGWRVVARYWPPHRVGLV